LAVVSEDYLDNGMIYDVDFTALTEFYFSIDNGTRRVIAELGIERRHFLIFGPVDDPEGIPAAASWHFLFYFCYGYLLSHV
jgi:hypothetical protein